MDIKKTIKDWMLPIAMVTGASIYLLYDAMPEQVHAAGPFLSGLVSVLQPLLIFSMLFLTFCRIEPKDLKPHRWHWWLLLIQGGLFVGLGMLAVWLVETAPGEYHDKIVLVESAMLCLICPTATAAAVVTRKLGGDVAGITTYTILINLLTAVLVPVMVPLINPVHGVEFWTAFSVIMVKIFPLLILPCLAAWLVRYLAPGIHRKLLSVPDLAFYLWAVALTLAITVTTKSIVQSEMAVNLLLLMSLVSLVCCIFQFTVGRFVGSCYRPRRRLRAAVCAASAASLDTPAPSDVRCAHPTSGDQSHVECDTVSGASPHAPAPSDVRCAHPTTSLRLWSPRFRAAGGTVLDAQEREVEARGKRVRTVTAGQALGQKNTVFAIWMGYTFMTPETAIVGGLYSIWHNLYNAWQLYRTERKSLPGIVAEKSCNSSETVSEIRTPKK